MVNKEVVRKRLSKLETYLNILKELKKYNFDDFVSSPERYGSVERFYTFQSKPLTILEIT